MQDFADRLERSWNAAQYLYFGLPLAWLCLLASFLVPIGLVFVLFVIGAPAWPEIVLVLRRLAGYERTRAGTRLGTPVPELYLPLDGAPADRIRLALTDPGTWRDARWLPVLTCSVIGFTVLSVPLWGAGLVVDGARMGLGGALDRRRAEHSGVPAAPRTSLVLRHLDTLADTQARWSARLLRPSASARLAERVAELSDTRAGAVEAHSAELRRIERDLHDGVQAQLVALSMRIGLARQQVRADPDAALARLDEAQEGVEGALAELRQVVRTVHPPVLTDRGLAGAVRALAASSAIPVEMGLSAVESGHRLPASVEAAAYFAVAEALTNIRKHSRATRASVRFTRTNGLLRVTVTDDGAGGADEYGGSGLLGIRRRVAALDGTTGLTSPPGGPTELRVELPCGS
ncbi:MULTISPECIES: sensor histidine kinase [Streptomyces]|uniref:sensor histidine kinase n=1 Tax=Streptomyces TaxID=1883 RepID=UPI00069C2612|nr:sensor histidine kinase [Streptomyces sp. SID7805]MYU52212.1 sensor histidine kinase [Streptomyces sp. SID7805]